MSGQIQITEWDLKRVELPHCVLWSSVTPIETRPVHIKGPPGHNRNPEFRWQAPLAHIQHESRSRGASLVLLLPQTHLTNTRDVPASPTTCPSACGQHDLWGFLPHLPQQETERPCGLLRLLPTVLTRLCWLLSSGPGVQVFAWQEPVGAAAA